MLIVGICTKNCEDTVGEVMKKADQGLEEFFPQEESMIIVSDGFSQDKTLKVAEETPLKAKKRVVTQEGGPGKGNGVKTILKIAKEEDGEAVALIDGDLLSVEPVWIKKLLSPIKEGKDLVIPFYIRHPFDGVITNQIAYPLTAVLYGKEVRQPIGGEFSLSSSFIEKILTHPLFPEKFGIDIFLTTTSLAEEFQVVESVLGRKEHTSTRQYQDPRKLLVPMFYQVVGTLFELFLYYREKTKNVTRIVKVPRLGEVPEGGAKEIQQDVDKLLGFFWEDYQKFYDNSPHAQFLSPVKEEIQENIKRKPFSFPVETWAKCVFLGLNNYQKAKQETLDVLRVFWQARYISLIIESKNLPQEEVEKKIQSQVGIFWKYRSLLA